VIPFSVVENWILETAAQISADRADFSRKPGDLRTRLNFLKPASIEELVAVPNVTANSWNKQTR